MSRPRLTDMTIQFPRLVAAAAAVLTPRQIGALADSLDVTYEDVHKLLLRGTNRWEAIRAAAQGVRLHAASDLANPLGYYCAPNAATPDYVPCRDFRQFLAYGFALCYIGEHDTTLTITAADLYALRESFLACVESAMELYPEAKPGERVCGDWESVTLYDASRSEEAIRQGEDAPGYDADHETEAGWRFERLDREDRDDWCRAQDLESGLPEREGHLLFVWAWSQADDIAIWLSEDCLFTEGKRDEAMIQKAIAEARQVNESLKLG